MVIKKIKQNYADWINFVNKLEVLEKHCNLKQEQVSFCEAVDGGCRITRKKLLHERSCLHARPDAE